MTLSHASIEAVPPHRRLQSQRVLSGDVYQQTRVLPKEYWPTRRDRIIVDLDHIIRGCASMGKVAAEEDVLG